MCIKLFLKSYEVQAQQKWNLSEQFFVTIIVFKVTSGLNMKKQVDFKPEMSAIVFSAKTYSVCTMFCKVTLGLYMKKQVGFYIRLISNVFFVKKCSVSRIICEPHQG